MSDFYAVGFQVLTWFFALVGLLSVAATVSVVSQAQSQRWPGTWPQLLMVGAILSLIGSLGSAVIGLLSIYEPWVGVLPMLLDLAGAVLLLAGIATIEVPVADGGRHG